MEYLIVPLEDLKEFDTQWEYRRRSNDGTKAIIHKEIFDKINPMANVMTLNLVEGEEDVDPQYPYPLVTGEELNNMEDFKQKDEELI